MKHFENAPFRVILDVAHNPDGIEHLFSKVKKTFPRKSIHTVYAASQDKDTQGCLQIILQNSKSITFVEATSERAEKGEVLLQKAEDLSSAAMLSAFPTIEEGLHSAFHKAVADNGVLVVCGTFFIM